jgi:hypothetical protein
MEAPPQMVPQVVQVAVAVVAEAANKEPVAREILQLLHLLKDMLVELHGHKMAMLLAVAVGAQEQLVEMRLAQA